MITLCIDARMAHSSGIGTCIRQIVPHLNQPPFRISLLVNQKKHSWCKEVEQIYFDAKIYSIREQLLFPLKIPRCDLFWSPHYNIPLLPIRAKKRIVTIHDVCHLAFKQTFSWPKRVYAKFVMKKALRTSDAIVTDSIFSRDELEKYLGKTNQEIQIIYPGVNRSQFQRIIDISTLEKLRNKYRLPERFVLFVGNLKPHKNLSGLIGAFSDISDPHLGLVIIGKSKELRHSCQTAEQKKVYFIGCIPDEDLVGLYSLADLFVLPSFYEGFGLPPLEAMSCGCPTIVSTAASLPEVCGDASLYFDPYNHRQIRDAIIKVTTNQSLKSQMIQRGYERVKMFDWALAAKRYQDLFKKLL